VPNKNNTLPFRLEPAAIEQRVQNLEQGVKDHQAQTAAQFNSLSQQIANLSTKLDERAKIPWPALGVMLSFLTVVGGLVWYPVKAELDRHGRVVEKMQDELITSKEVEYRLGTSGQRRDDWQRSAEDRMRRNEARIDDVTKLIVPRGEHEEKWRSNDRQFTDTQRQLDEIKKAYSDLYSPRDALTNLQRRLEDVERRLALAQQQAQEAQRPR